ncbi:hypothetical protein V8G54_028990 [Vigna mungo]|uniref:Uncharacterized protein n=1 Tax=Vigna mungo TaxID=3915 RepID=A0AAQ3MUD5_VIGMU
MEKWSLSVSYEALSVKVFQSKLSRKLCRAPPKSPFLLLGSTYSLTIFASEVVGGSLVGHPLASFVERRGEVFSPSPLWIWVLGALLSLSASCFAFESKGVDKIRRNNQRLRSLRNKIVVVRKELTDLRKLRNFRYVEEDGVEGEGKEDYGGEEVPSEAHDEAAGQANKAGADEGPANKAPVDEAAEAHEASKAHEERASEAHEAIIDYTLNVIDYKTTDSFHTRPHFTSFYLLQTTAIPSTLATTYK